MILLHVDLHVVDMSMVDNGLALVGLTPHGNQRPGRCVLIAPPSKLAVIDTARARDYLVIVIHVGVDSADLAVGRVRTRAKEGGHDVPEDKIRARCERSQPLVREAVLRADRGTVFDNSRLNTPPQQMLVIAKGRLVQTAPILPQRVLTAYATDLIV